MIAASRLMGLPLYRAEAYGKPHVGAVYRGSRWELDSDRCAVCGRMATNVHHVAPRRLGRTFELRAGGRTWLLRSALFAMCGSGTTGCHGRVHDGMLRIEWEWDTEANRDAWWDGELLERYGPHDQRLYRYGRWVVTDRVTEETFEIRGF